MSNSNTDDHVCPICLGDGYTTEKHDEDSTHREECPCQQRETTPFKSSFFDFMCDIIRDTDRLKMNHMIRTGYADEQDAIARRKLND